MISQKVVSWTAVCVLLLGLIFCSGKPEQDDKDTELMIGVKIYDYDKNYQDLFEEWFSLGINTALVSVSLLSDDEFRELAKKFGIRLFLIVPIFYDSEELQKNPDLYAITDKGERATEEWVNFVCPTREDYKRGKIEYIKTLIRKYSPDGISCLLYTSPSPRD